ncbi:MAG: STAS domain-containing protein [Acidobacteria bacterium]|nr:STAS domain-containing protein [Acidobacteriota bacterium]MCW5966874.1 STAS domain-containing protein [Blastocatellales bacterium]
MLTIGIHYIDAIASLDLRGKFIKGQGGFQLQMLVDKVLTAETSRVILNLTGVPIIDSMGIGEIVRAYNKVRDAGGELKLVGLTDRVYGALKITQLLELIDSCKTEEEAVERFGADHSDSADDGREEKKKTRGRKRKAADTASESDAGAE